MTIHDIKKLIDYWVKASIEDIQVAKNLLQNGRHAYSLFFSHLAIEKMLKAVVVEKTREHAPFTHNLPFLAGRANLVLQKNDMDFLAEMTHWNLEARYPSDIETMKKSAEKAKAKELFKRTEAFIKWLKNQLLENY